MKTKLLCLIFLSLFFGCQKENVEIPDTGRKIVINGLITTDSLLNARIDNSYYIKDYQMYWDTTGFEGADVRIYSNNIFSDSLSYSVQDNNYDQYSVYPTSNYKSKNVFPLSGYEYKVIVKRPGFPDATATTMMPNLVKIESVDTSRVNDGGNFTMNCKIGFSDPPAEKNYYLFNIIMTRVFPWSKSYLAFDSQDPVIEEELTSNRGSGSSSYVVYDKDGFVFSDKLIDGKKYSLNVSFKGHYYNYSYFPDNPWPETSYIYYFRLISITEDYFKFIKTLNLFNATYMNPLAEPVMVHSNVYGGYGIFAGGAVSTDSIILYHTIR